MKPYLIAKMKEKELPVLDCLAVTAGAAAKMFGISRAQWWKLRKANKLPLPVMLGARAPRWRVEELRAWLAADCPNQEEWIGARK